MLSIRTTKTASGATAVQVVRYVDRKVVIMKHIGSAHGDEELDVLKRDARTWVQRETGQRPLLLLDEPVPSHVHLRSCRCIGVRHLVAHRILILLLDHLRIADLLPPILRDLSVMRVLHPASKRRSLELLERYTGITHHRPTLYDALPAFIANKTEIERRAVTFTREHLSFDCSLVLYDVTTLYFESFREDEPEDDEKGLRKTGFSKDNKPQQPQIVIGLLVTPEGFPLAYDVFRGNTFEGKTILPILTDFREKHAVKECTVVADAAMLSMENIGEMRSKKLSYIVGARVANLSQKRIEEISMLGGKDGATMRLSTQHGDIICSFSKSRYRKDAHEMEKQIARAKALVTKGEPGRKAKFVRKQGGRYTFNEKLAEKTGKLLGIKGYYTDIPETQMSNAQIIEHYRNLWRVEQSFRMSKHDLEMRPIFHRKEDAIRAHILLCFVALAMGKVMEIRSGHSLRYCVDLLMECTDAVVWDETQEREFLLPAAMPQSVRDLIRKLRVQY